MAPPTTTLEPLQRVAVGWVGWVDGVRCAFDVGVQPRRHLLLNKASVLALFSQNSSRLLRSPWEPGAATWGLTGFKLPTVGGSRSARGPQTTITGESQAQVLALIVE